MTEQQPKIQTGRRFLQLAEAITGAPVAPPCATLAEVRSAVHAFELAMLKYGMTLEAHQRVEEVLRMQRKLHGPDAFARLWGVCFCDDGDAPLCPQIFTSFML